MKTLYIHRHAKAVKEGYAHDFSRSLQLKGIEDAHRMGRYLRHKELVAALVISSPANRALQTAELVTEHTGEKLVKDDRLYKQGWLAILSALREQDAALQSVRIVGHNPELEELAAALCGIRPGGIRMATCSVVAISCDIHSWDALEPASCFLEWSIRPLHI